ncbi:MAG: DUF4388 domain-containing protein [Actinomycetota bacterium]
MALQGTLSDFGIDEVLRLLEHGKKRGRLRVTGPAGSGNVWVDDGTVIASANSADEPGGDHTEVVFQLMRLEDGEFNFHADDAPSTSPATESIAEVISASTGRLAEWKQLSEVLPSVEHWLSLAEEIASAATLEPAQWKVLALIGGGTRITTCVEELGLGLVPGCRLIVELVDRSLLLVTEEQPARAVARSGKVDPQLPSVGAAHDDDEPATAPDAAEEAVADAPAAEAPAAEAAPVEEPAEDTAPAEPAPAADAGPEDEPPAESGEEPAPGAQGADVDADVNPRALLRLLNSVK